MKAKMISKIILSVWILFFLFFFGEVNLNVAQAATYTVTNTDDSGAGSLRQAILDANANPGPDNIEFAIPGAGVHTINPTSEALAPITDPVTINGYTQQGAAVATASSQAVILIEISGEFLPGAPGRAGLALSPGSSGSTIRGLSINRFKRAGAGSGHAISIPGPDGGLNWIAGNYLNVAPDGVTVFTGSPSWGDGILDAGIGGNIIGHDRLGPNISNPAADRNIISGAGTGRNGILLSPTPSSSASANEIRGNYIGTDVTGTLDLGNPSSGIRVESASNTIVDNVISGNGFNGVRSVPSANPLIPSGNNLIENNMVGTDVTGTLDLGNDNDGIHLGTSNNTVVDNVISGNFGGVFAPGPGSNTIKDNKIGTDLTGMLPIGNAAGMVVISSHNTIKGNIIAFNDSVGIIVLPSTTGVPSVSNAIFSNFIFGNPGSGLSGLGIELTTSNCPPSCIFDGVTLNDPLDEDVGFANNLQNFPVIDVADSFLNPSHVQVRVRLDSKPNQDYLIQGFLSKLADPSGHGEGEVLVAEKIVTTDATGHVDFRLPVPLKLLPVRSIFTTTATDLITMDTSEFSKWENLDDVQDVRGSPTAYENVIDVVGDDGLGSMPREWEEPLITEEMSTEE